MDLMHLFALVRAWITQATEAFRHCDRFVNQAFQVLNFFLIAVGSALFGISYGESLDRTSQ